MDVSDATRSRLQEQLAQEERRRENDMARAQASLEAARAALREQGTGERLKSWVKEKLGREDP